MKTIFLLLVSFTFCLLLQAETPVATSYAGGTGTEADPYQIATLAELRLLSEKAAHWYRGKYFVLTANINAADTKTWNDGKGFSPIGDTDINFRSSFDGNFYIIDSLCVNDPKNGIKGLFGRTYGATIKNLGLTNCTIVSKQTAGTLIGNDDYSTIEKCFTNGTTVSTENPLTLTNIISDTAIYAVFETNTGIEVNNADFSFKIAPNPTTGLVSIPLESGIANLTVFNITGKQVYSNPAFEGGSVNLTDLQQGLYVVKLYSEGKLSIVKLIKK